MTRYIDQLNECTDPVSGDYLLIYDASAGATDKDRKANVNKFAVLANAQSFTAAQTFAPATSTTKGIIANAASGASVALQEWQYNTQLRAFVQLTGSTTQFALAAFDNGSGLGPGIYIDRNNNASTPAAGFLRLTNRGGSDYYTWADASGNLRIGTTSPTNANDGTGTVVGTQTSSLDSKNILGSVISPQEALQNLLNACKALRRFSYKNGAFNGEEFEGLVVDYAPRYGMDRDEAHPAGKSLNVITLLGDLVQAVAYLNQKIEAMEGE